MNSEHDLSDFLIMESSNEKEHLGKVMKITSKSLNYTSKQRYIVFSNKTGVLINILDKKP